MKRKPMKNMLFAVLTGLAIFSLPSSGASAAGICNCCTGEVEELCKSACKAAVKQDGICRPAAFFGDAPGIGGDTPLNGFSYKNLSLDGATPIELEIIRRWLERERRKMERTARRSQRNYRRGRISSEQYKASRSFREEAIINYQLGIQEYISQIK